MESTYGIKRLLGEGDKCYTLFLCIYLQNSHTKLSLALFIKLDGEMKVCEKPSVVYAGVGASYVSTWRSSPLDV